MVEIVQKWLARNAFFDISKNTVEKFMAWQGKAVASGQSLCGTLVEACMNALDISEPRTMEIIKKRVAHVAHNKDVVGDFMFLDEAEANLDAADKKEAKGVQTRLKQNAEAHTELLAEFKERRARPSHPSKKAKTNKLANYKGLKALPKELHQEAFMQKEYKFMMPPESYLWVDRGGQAWFTRVPPMRSQPRYWRREGSEYNALIRALKDAWAQWLSLEGMEESECPVDGLMGIGCMV